jgi:adenylate kinase
MRLVVIGAPGAGKGTQAKILANLYKVPHVSTGDLLRELVAGDDTFGHACKLIMNAGELVPDSIVIDLIRGIIDSKEFIFDGFPRTLVQAEILHRMLTARSAPLDKVIYVTIEDDVIIRRMAGRKVCSGCNAIFNTQHNPPKEEDVCDFCLNRLYVRNDDCEDVVRRRLRNYYALTEPIIEYYRQQGLVFEVSGLGDIDDITEAIINDLSNNFRGSGN